MLLNPLETHDRLLHFKKTQSQNISECCQDLINQRPYGNYPFYAFAHARTEEDGVTKRLIWQPRLTKPKAQTNSMLFKLYPGSDLVKVIWMIPAREMWGQYEKGKLTESDIVYQSIQDFQFNRDFLEKKEEDDLNDETIEAIYKDIAHQGRMKKFNQTLKRIV